MGNKLNNDLKNSGTARKETTKTKWGRTKSFWSKRIKRYWRVIIAILILAACQGLIHWLWEPFDGAFMERDPALSHPWFDDPETRLPVAVIIFLAIFLPMILIIILLLVVRFVRRPDHIHPKAIDPFYGLMITFEAFTINGLFSEFLKSYNGKKRPNFFAMCNYYGYRDALASQNYTYYLSMTDPNRFGSMKNCLDQSTFSSWQSRSSYPSGHASYSFCGYTIFGLLSIYVWHCVTKKHKIFKILFFVCLMLVATVLSFSRTLDYWHDPGDIYAGAVLGAVSSAIIFFLNFSFSTVDKLKKAVVEARKTHTDVTDQSPPETSSEDSSKSEEKIDTSTNETAEKV